MPYVEKNEIDVILIEKYLKLKENRMFGIAQKNNGKTIVTSVFDDVNEAKKQLKQEANTLNCPEKIIWVDDSHFKLLSVNGDTKEFFVVSVEKSKK